MAKITEADLDPIEQSVDTAAQAQGIQLDPVLGAIRPGDVEARRAQVAAQAALEQPNVVRERLGSQDLSSLDPTNALAAPTTAGQFIASSIPAILREAGTGVSEVIGGAKDLFTTSPFQGPAQPAESASGALANLLQSPIGRVAGGLARTVAAPLAPIANLATAAGEAASDVLSRRGLSGAADVAGATLEAVGQVLAPGQLAQVLRGTPGLSAAANVSKRQRGAQLKAEIAAIEKEAAEKVTAIRSGQEAAVESVESIADAARQSVPTGSQLRQRFAPNAPLGEEVGQAFKSSYASQASASSKRFNRLYNEIEEAGAGIDTPASNYLEAGGRLQKARGVTGIPGTTPERVAGKLKQQLDNEALDDNTYQALKDQLDATPPADKARVQSVIDEFLEGSGVPEQPTVRDLILERQRLRAGARATKDDNTRRQFTNLIRGVEEDIATADETIAKSLFSVDKLYATEHAPLFSRGSVTRAIAEGRPEAVVDAIYRPTAGAGGRIGPQNKAVESITRARELIKDSDQWEAINRSFLNKGITQAFEGDVFSPKKMAQWWNKYTDPAGTGNKVLRAGLGDRQFQDIQSVMNQIQRSTRKSIDDFAKEATRGFEKAGQASADTVQKAAAATKKRLEEEIAKVSGTRAGRIASRFESIGTGIVTTSAISGAMGSSTAASRGFVGTAIILSANALGRLMSQAQGRSLVKAMARATPGTAEAASVARRVQNFLDRTDERE